MHHFAMKCSTNCTLLLSIEVINETIYHACFTYSSIAEHTYFEILYLGHTIITHRLAIEVKFRISCHRVGAIIIYHVIYILAN